MTDCSKWCRLLYIAQSALCGTDCCPRHRLLSLTQVTFHETNGSMLDGLLYMAKTNVCGRDCPIRHRRLLMAQTALREMVCSIWDGPLYIAQTILYRLLSITQTFRDTDSSAWHRLTCMAQTFQCGKTAVYSTDCPSWHRLLSMAYSELLGTDYLCLVMCMFMGFFTKYVTCVYVCVFVCLCLCVCVCV